MGDRGNIVIRDRGDDVWLYTHWRGSDIAEVVAEALALKQRWDDPAYLARIIADVLWGGQERSTTGFGISCCMGDNEHPILVVDCDTQKVHTVPEKFTKDGKLPKELPESVQSVPFADFAK
jgi:hypothetical protein